MVSASRPSGDIYYPEEDGKVSESTIHYLQALLLIDLLRRFFKGVPDVFVGGNLFVYYREGDPKTCFSPDVMVARGVKPRPDTERGSYRVWEEGVPPTVIIELTSNSTRTADTMRKPRIYATLGVQEYYLFDPLGEFLVPPLQGYHLNAAGHYDRLPDGDMDSPVLGLRLVVREGWLRLWNPATSSLLPTAEEEEAARQVAEAALVAERSARQASEQTAAAEISRLRAALARQQEQS